MHFASIYLIDTVWSLDSEYTYIVPEKLIDSVYPGCLVVVPFGNSNVKKTGFVVSVKEETVYEEVSIKGLKEIISVPDYGKFLPEESVGLARFIKQRCFCTIGSAVRVMLPPGVNTKRSICYVASDEPQSFPNEQCEEIYRYIQSKERIAHNDLVKLFGEDESIKKLIKLKAIIKIETIPEKENTRTETFCSIKRLPERGDRVSSSREKVIDVLLKERVLSIKELCEKADVSTAVINGLEKIGIISFEKKILFRGAPIENAEKQFAKEMLSGEQLEAYNTLCGLLDSGEPKASLLFGVTGSGKTSVIIGAVDYTLKKGKTAIVMLPEIGLTAQAMGIFVSYFGSRCVLLHSMLSEGERIDAYRRIINGEAVVVVGTRSAVFAPLKNIGLIVMDEEQESSYKSEKSPKYHARDIARYRCSVNNAVMLLASATPSVESYYKALQGVYTLIRMKNRYGNMPLPDVEVADLRIDREEAEKGMIGDVLLSALEETKENGDQSILFVNRRGHSSHVGCHACGYVYTCPNCSVSLTYHAYTTYGKGKLTCHYCGYSINKPAKCPGCDSLHLNYSGYGTQLLQEELEEKLRRAVALRMDADTTARKSAHDKILKNFRERKADILYGTQMVAKGLDFPGVTLVGVVHADAVLYMNDFRASERTFSLITQLIGRAGRGGKHGRAIVQTYNPDHQVLKLAITQDYEKFFESEIALRKAVVFPPFCDIAVFSVASKDETQLNNASIKLDSIYKSIKEESFAKLTAMKFGPFREGIYKINGSFRQKLVVKYRDSAEARRFFAKIIDGFLALNMENVRVEIDINPGTV